MLAYDELCETLCADPHAASAMNAMGRGFLNSPLAYLTELYLDNMTNHQRSVVSPFLLPLLASKLDVQVKARDATVLLLPLL